MISRGTLFETTEGIFKFVGMRNQYLYTMREMCVSKNGNLYPIKGEKGVHYWTKFEIENANRI